MHLCIPIFTGNFGLDKCNERSRFYQIKLLGATIEWCSVGISGRVFIRDGVTNSIAKLCWYKCCWALWTFGIRCLVIWLVWTWTDCEEKFFDCLCQITTFAVFARRHVFPVEHTDFYKGNQTKKWFFASNIRIEHFFYFLFRSWKQLILYLLYYKVLSHKIIVYELYNGTQKFSKWKQFSQNLKEKTLVFFLWLKSLNNKNVSY